MMIIHIYEIAFILLTIILCLLDTTVEIFFTTYLPGLFFVPFLCNFGYKLWKKYQVSDEIEISKIGSILEGVFIILMTIFMIVHYIFRLHSTGEIFFIILTKAKTEFASTRQPQ